VENFISRVHVLFAEVVNREGQQLTRIRRRELRKRGFAAAGGGGRRRGGRRMGRVRRRRGRRRSHRFCHFNQRSCHVLHLAKGGCNVCARRRVKTQLPRVRQRVDNRPAGSGQSRQVRDWTDDLYIWHAMPAEARGESQKSFSADIVTAMRFEASVPNSCNLSKGAVQQRLDANCLFIHDPRRYVVIQVVEARCATKRE
jgi:hypothetical protein